MEELSIDHKQLAELAKKHGIRFIVLYGSYANDSAHDESDVDVGVYLEPEKLGHFDFRAYGAALRDLERALHTGFRTIDLVTLNTANILLRYEITSQGKLLCGDANAYVQYCGFAYRDYIDAKPLFDLENRMIQKRHELIQRHVAA